MEEGERKTETEIEKVRETETVTERGQIDFVFSI